MSRSGLDALFHAIGHSHGCPHLRELAINTHRGHVGAVASALEMGAFGALETLRFPNSYAPSAEGEEVAALEAALQRNPLPSLRTLEIGFQAFHNAPLVRAFRAGACANLRCLCLGNGNTDLGELAQVLKDGWGRQLRSLSLQAPVEAIDAMAAVIQAVACSGACPALQELKVWVSHHRQFQGKPPPEATAYDAMVRGLAIILSGGAACSSSLVKLSLHEWDIDADDMRVLSGALSLPTSARIAILHLRNMERLGDAGVRHLMRAMQRGLGTWLREVDLTDSEYDQRLFTGFDRWCPHLEKVVGHKDLTARVQRRRADRLW